MNATPPEPYAPTPADGRWAFIRDVLVLQAKLVLGNLLNLILVPVTVVAALFDLFSKPRQRHGEHFYKALEFGREIEEGINVYGAIGGYHATGSAPADGSERAPAANVDAVIRRVEEAVVREVSKGGTAASVKAAVDRALDGFQRKPKR